MEECYNVHVKYNHSLESDPSSPVSDSGEQRIFDSQRLTIQRKFNNNYISTDDAQTANVLLLFEKQDFKNSIICQLCKKLALFPAKVCNKQSCRHTMCNSCLHKILIRKLPCPFCRRSLMWGPADHLVEELVNSMSLDCWEEGCGQKVRIRDYERHLKYVCGKKVIACYNYPCEKLGNEHEMKNHAQICQYKSNGFRSASVVMDDPHGNGILSHAQRKKESEALSKKTSIIQSFSEALKKFDTAEKEKEQSEDDNDNDDEYFAIGGGKMEEEEYYIHPRNSRKRTTAPPVEQPDWKDTELWKDIKRVLRFSVFMTKGVLSLVG